jgi:hypothetical protein
MYYNYHETRKGGQGPIWAVAPLMMIRMGNVKSDFGKEGKNN